MPIIGLTGGFGTGKSFVASIFKRLGAKVIDADKLAHRALKKGSATYKRIIATFGASILDTKGAINRRELAEIVFNNNDGLTNLNSIVHPEVIRKIRGRIKSADKSEILIIDAPLLCETSLSGLTNVLVVVRASRENQIERCMKKFSIKKKDVVKRMACQIPLREKVLMADYIIHNDGTRKETEKQVKKIWQDLKKGAKVWR